MDTMDTTEFYAAGAEFRRAQARAREARAVAEAAAETAAERGARRRRDDAAPGLWGRPRAAKAETQDSTDGSTDAAGGARGDAPAGGVDTDAATWPRLDPAARHGLAGELVALYEPHTEADPVALLVSFLAEASVMLNSGPHLLINGARRPLTIWAVLVGDTAKARKGTTDDLIRHFLRQVDPEWTRGAYAGTPSTGEGLAYAVRDPEAREDRDEADPTTRVRATDPGVTDKRLYLCVGEFGAMLRVMARDGNSLSGAIRDAWDGRDLAPMTKTQRVRATRPHIGMVGHITRDELLRTLAAADVHNGFSNRFLWVLVRRSKLLPDPSDPDREAEADLARRVRRALQDGRTHARIDRTPAAAARWRQTYPELSAARPGLVGALLARAEAHVLRLAAVYAILDGQGMIDAPHLDAALAVWAYAEASARALFGDRTGDRVADTILGEVRRTGRLTDTETSALLGRHVSAARLAEAKAALVGAGLIRQEITRTSGRPETAWVPA